jgi:hypothetical protein
MSLNITNIKIENVKKGTTNQVNKGIHGKFTLDMYLEDGTHFITLKNMTLRKTRNGAWYIQPPYEVWGEDKKKSFFYFLYPSSEDRDAKLKDLVTKVVDMVDSASDAGSSSSSSSEAATSTSGGMGESLF